MDEGVLQQSDSKQAKLETNPRGRRRMSTPACDAGLPWCPCSFPEQWVWPQGWLQGPAVSVL